MPTVVNHGNITMTLEEFGSADPKHWRPTLVKGTIHVSRGVHREVPTPIAMALLNNPSADVAKKPNKQDALTPDRPLNTDYSHLIGLSIGGSDVSGNIVPMYSHLNQGLWQRLEEEIAKLKEEDIKARTQATKAAQQLPTRVASVEVSVVYEDTSSQIPKTISFKLLDENDKIYDNTFPRTIQNKGVEPKQVRRPFAQLAHELCKALESAESRVAQRWSLEDELDERALTLPDKTERPYAALDLLWVRGELDVYMKSEGIQRSEKKRFAKFCDFEDWQRKLILLVNRRNNDGWLKSDQPGQDTNERLLEEAGDRQAQIDHIVPKSRGGANAFSNAQVISRSYNGHLNNVKDKESKSDFSARDINPSSIIVPSSASAAAAAAAKGGRVLRNQVEKPEKKEDGEASKNYRERDYEPRRRRD